jgi:hypothetical protein
MKELLVAYVLACGPAGATSDGAAPIVGRTPSQASAMLRGYAEPMKGVHQSTRVWRSTPTKHGEAIVFFGRPEWRDAYDMAGRASEDCREVAAKVVDEIRESIRTTPKNQIEEMARLKDNYRCAIRRKDARIAELEAKIESLTKEIKKAKPVAIPAPVVKANIKAETLFRNATPQITSETRVTIAKTPPSRFSADPGHVGEFSRQWAENRGVSA